MAGGIGSRREGRERALTLLYEADIREWSAAEVLAAQILPPDPFVAGLVAGVHDHRARIDAMLDRLAVGWDVERMAVIDRNVLRLGAFELLERSDVPTAVAISEAVELAKQYSTDESGRFVNGILSSLAGEARAPAGGG